MSLKNWCESFVNCCKNASEWLMEYSENDRIKFMQNIAVFIYQSFLKDWPFMLTNDIIFSINSVLFKEKQDSIQKEIMDKIVILIPWFTSNIWALPNLIKAIDSGGYTCLPINKRLLFHNIEKVQWQIIKEVLSIIKKNKDKQMVLFWYSYWWSIAHMIWAKRNIPQVTYWAPLDSANIPITVWLHLFWKTIATPMGANGNSIDIVEAFSPENPFPWDRIVAKWVLNHFSPNRKEAIDLIMEWIDQSFKNMNK